MDLEEQIYMKIPKRLEKIKEDVYYDTDALKLKQSICRFVQAARQFNKQLWHLLVEKI